MFEELLVDFEDVIFSPYLLSSYTNISNLFSISRYAFPNPNFLKWKLSFHQEAFELFGQIEGFELFGEGKRFKTVKEAKQFALSFLYKQDKLPSNFNPNLKNRNTFFACPKYVEQTFTEVHQLAHFMPRFKPLYKSRWVLYDDLFLNDSVTQQQYLELFPNTSFIELQTRKQGLQILNTFLSNNLHQLYEEEYYTDWKKAVKQKSSQVLTGKNYEDEIWWAIFVRPDIDLTTIF